MIYPDTMTLKNRAITKVIACIDSCETLDQIVSCKKLINLIYNYGVSKQVLTYLTLKYRYKKISITGE